MGRRIVRKKVASGEKVQKHIRLDPSLHADVEAICEHTNREYNEVIELLLEEAVRNELAEIESEKVASGGPSKS